MQPAPRPPRIQPPREREPLRLWSPYDRERWIQDCQDSDREGGSTWNNSTRYDWKVLPKLSPEKIITGTEFDEYRSQVTAALAKTMYSPKFRKIPYTFYDMLLSRVYRDPLLMNHTRVLIKGSNAYRYHLEENDGDWSDMDLVIYIDPNLGFPQWKRIKNQVHTVTLQTMSMYKRALDYMFCFNKPNDDRFLNDEEIQSFRSTYADHLSQITVPDGSILSPFVDLEARNHSSRNSFLITESKAWDDHNIKIDVPHFANCERVFLARTPIYLSCNSTIKYQKGDVIGDFHLFRIRLNNKRTFKDPKKWEKVPSDFIDISIPNRNDTGLRDFWKNGQYTTVLDRVTDTWIDIPDVKTCVVELEKMLTCFDCPENKKEKREKKLEMLKQLLNK